MKNNIDLARALIRATGGTLNEVTSLTKDDVLFDSYGHMTVRIGMGASTREAIVDDEEPVKELLDDARAAGREMLLETVIPNFDCTHERAAYAQRLYALVSAGGRTIGERFHTYGDVKYDAVAMAVVFKSMGINDTRTMAKFFKEEV